jgi:heptaprenyl diphosphate synthase
VIRLQDIRKKLSDIKEQVELKVLHPYLLHFIQTPYIDEDKLLIFISLMDQLELSYSQMKNYALSAMLIQIALDTHEYVTNEVINNDEKAKATSRQLTVLAGDYYSGLYYKLLADTDDISMIKVLAKGIKEVNEHKIFLYQKDFDGIEKLMKSIKIIESSLLTKVSEYFQAGIWTEVIGHLMLVKRLLFEKKRFIHTES